MARQHNIELKVVDAGVAADFNVFINDGKGRQVQDYKHGWAHSDPQLITAYKVRLGSRDALIEPAMSAEECLQAIRAGIDIANQLISVQQSVPKVASDWPQPVKYGELTMLNFSHVL